MRAHPAPAESLLEFAVADVRICLCSCQPGGHGSDGQQPGDVLVGLCDVALPGSMRRALQRLVHVLGR